MTDNLTPAQRSYTMSRIRNKGNGATELRFINLIRKHHITGWRRGSNLIGRPDFVFPQKRVVVFIDGDFWHGNPNKFRLPKSNLSYWRKKILSNKQRDKQVTRTLRRCGWKVLRFWQSSLKNEQAVIRRLENAIQV